MESKKKKRAKPRSKKMSDATLDTKEQSMAEAFAPHEVLPSDEIVELAGQENAPPLEMTEDVLEEIVGKQVGQNEQQEDNRNATRHHLNEFNIWHLIAKTWNAPLGWEHITQAMQLGSAGCLVMVKETMDNKMHSTMTFVPYATITEDSDGKKQII